MNILLINTGSVVECLISSSIIKGLQKKYNNPKFNIIVDNDINCKNIFKYNKNVLNTYLLDDCYSIPYNLFNLSYDIIINLNCKNSIISLFENHINNENCQKFGLGFNNKSDYFYEVLYGNKKSRKNIFQIYFNLAGLKWAGEGYDFFYHPQAKSSPKRVGFALSNQKLKSYVLDHLKLEEKNIWTIPFRKNVFKMADEINKCKYIVTDDFLTINLACALRKKLLFLKSMPFNYKIELFQKKAILEVPKHILLK